MLRQTIACLLVFCCSLPARPATQATAEFDAASIKPRPEDLKLSTLKESPGTFVRRSATLLNLVAYAYRVPEFEVVGNADWVMSSPWEVIGKYDPSIPSAQVPELVQSLLTKRFSLRIHEQMRDAPVYALNVVRPGRLGPGLSASRVECVVPTTGALATGETEKQTPRGCMRRIYRQANAVEYQLEGMELTDLVEMLTREVGRRVRDATELHGRFDVRLSFQPRQSLAQSSDVPAITSALPEQLGLKLASERGSVRFIVIDSAAFPTEN
jgi:uncharacterized protein (TIGR03435 family)